MTNLFAACRQGGQLTVKRVRLTQAVQNKLEGLFQGQEHKFLEGVIDEVPFSGSWKPDEDEILTMDMPADGQAIIAAAAANPVALPDINHQNFAGENIRGLFVVRGVGAGQRILMQAFSAQQLLSRRFAFLLEGNSFKELTDPAFTLDNKLVAVIENGVVKFKSFHNLKRILDLVEFYKAATDGELDDFCSHDLLEVPDALAFRAAADQVIRKLVHAVSGGQVLNIYDAQTIAAKAGAMGLNIIIQNGKLVMPTDRREVKNFLRFLDDAIYEASLSQNRYVTNSKRPLA